MLFSRRLPLVHVIALCRALRHGLGAGLTLVQMFRQQAERGARRVRPLARRVLSSLEKGMSLGDSLKTEKGHLPAIFFSLAEVGEETGHLAEIFGEMEKHFEARDRLRRQFRAQTMLPLIQLGAAFFILATVIFILGMVAAANPAAPIQGLFGLRGTVGAILFLVISFGSVGLMALVISVLFRWVRSSPALERVFAHVPVVGPCLEALNMQRFTTGLHLTLDSGMSIDRALRLSLRGTSSASYVAQIDTVTQAVKHGTTVLDALTRSGLFTVDFLSLVAIGEEAGRLPEVMRQQAEYWNEEAGQRFKIAVRLASLLIGLIYGAFMIWAIFSLAGVYFAAFKI